MFGRFNSSYPVAMNHRLESCWGRPCRPSAVPASSLTEQAKGRAAGWQGGGVRRRGAGGAGRGS